MKSRVLERIRFAGIAVSASFWLAGGANGPAADGEVPSKPASAETGGKVPKRAAPNPGPKAAEPEAGKTVQEASQGLGSFGKMLPLGQKNRDVKIPSFRDGNPSSFIRASTMTRLDDEKMDMERLDIRMFGETEDKDLRIMMPTATYQMVTEVLSSEDRSRVSRKDFDLQGDTLIFDTRSQQGKMTGHIHMIIHDADAFRQQPDKAAANGEKPTAPTTTPEKPKPSREKK